MPTIRSRYVQDRLRREPPTEANLSDYEDLFLLERFVVEGPRGWLEAMHYAQLRDGNPRAFEAIARELNPTAYRREVERRHRLARDQARWTRQECARRATLLQALGGPASGRELLRPLEESASRQRTLDGGGEPI